MLKPILPNKALKPALLTIGTLSAVLATGFYVFAVGEVFVASPLPFDASSGAVEFSKFVDVDKDGDDDLFLANSGKNRLFLNDGRGNFNESQNAGIADNGLSKMATFGDYDNDGNIDFFTPNIGGKNYLYHGNGDATFVKTALNLGDNGFSSYASWINLNDDNFLDLFLVDIYGANSIYKNNGNGTFTKLLQGEAVTELGKSYGIVTADINNDNKPDSLVLNNGANFLYLNDGFGTSTKVLNDPILVDTSISMGGDFGDMDNDGDMDLFVANYDQPSSLYSNDGNGTFVKIINWPGANLTKSSRSGKFADIDNDGDLDLFVINSDGESNTLYVNNGDGTFVSEELASNGHPTNAAFSDIDADGDLDLFMADSFGSNMIFRNSGNQNEWLNLNLRGTTSNSAAIGTRVKVESIVDGNSVAQIREISADDGDSFTLHFGLGDAEAISKITVWWPSGIVQTLRNVNTNQSLSIEENDEAILGNNLVLDGNMQSGLAWTAWGLPVTNEKIIYPEGNTQVAHIVSGGGGIQQSGIAVAKDLTYRLSFDVKIASGLVLPKLNILKNPNYNKHADFYDNNVALSWRNYSNWKHYTRVVTVPPDYNAAVNSIRLSLIASNSAGEAEAWIDNVELVEITNTNLISDGEMQFKQLWLLWGAPALNEKIYDGTLRSQVAHIKTTDLGSSGGIRQDYVKALPGHTYELSFDIKMLGGYLMPYLNILKNANYNKQADISKTTITLLARDFAQWTHYSRTVTIPLDYDPVANVLRLSLIARNKNAASEAWIDNVKFIEVLPE